MIFVSSVFYKKSTKRFLVQIIFNECNLNMEWKFLFYLFKPSFRFNKYSVANQEIKIKKILLVYYLLIKIDDL